MTPSNAWIRAGWVCALTCAAFPVAAQQPAAVSDKTPRLDWEQPVWCLQDREGNAFRVQHTPGPPGAARRDPTYLVAPDHTAWGEELSRTARCAIAPSASLERLRAERAQLVPAIAEAPPGSYRDESGRVFQVNFDMLKRFYLGAGWVPAWDLAGSAGDLGRVRFDMGLTASWVDRSARMRHTIRALEGDVALDDLAARGQLFSYDLAHSSTRPLLRVTTFFGQPRRYDGRVDVGFGLRVLGVQANTHRTPGLFELEYGQARAMFAFWQSADLSSYVRSFVGAGAGQLTDDEDGRRTQRYAGPVAGVESAFVMDRGGFHHLGARAGAGLPVFYQGLPAGTVRRRANAGLSYEVIFLAINDQPLTLRLEGNLDYRTDLPERASKWEASALSGVRFSFWAPARLDESLPPKRRPQRSMPVMP